MSERRKAIFNNYIPVNYIIKDGVHNREENTGCWENNFPNEGYFIGWV